MFYEKIKELRNKHNMTQEELATKLFVSRNAVSKWETNKGYPSIDTLKEISKVFNVSIDDLLNEKDIQQLTLTNYEKINQYSYIGLSFLVFALYFVFATILPFILFKVDPTSMMAYFIILGPISFILLAFITALFFKKKSYVAIASALAIIPTYICFDIFIQMSLSFYEVIYYILFLVSYFSLTTFLNHIFKKKTIKILKWIFLIITILLLICLIGTIIYNLTHYDPSYSAPKSIGVLIPILGYILPISLFLLLYLSFLKKDKTDK